MVALYILWKFSSVFVYAFRFIDFVLQISWKKEFIFSSRNTESNAQENEYDMSFSNFKNLLSHGKNLISSLQAPWAPSSGFLLNNCTF